MNTIQYIRKKRPRHRRGLLRLVEEKEWSIKRRVYKCGAGEPRVRIRKRRGVMRGSGVNPRRRQQENIHFMNRGHD